MKLFDNMNDLAAFAAVSLVFGLIRILVMPNDRGWKTFLTTFIVCIPVGILAGGICLEVFHLEYVALGASAAASLLAEQLIKVALASDLAGFMRTVFDKLLEKFTK